MHINGWVILGGIAAFIVVIYLFTRKGCDNEVAEILRLRIVRVDTWTEWREHLLGTDLYLKYRAINVIYRPDSIRSDFVRRVSSSAFTGTQDSQAPLRIWNQGTTLHIAPVTDDTTFQRLKEFFEQLVKREWARLPEKDFLVHTTVASLFQEVVLHGPNDRTLHIPLPFFYGE